MNQLDDSLISVVYRPSRSGDNQNRNESSDKVVFNKDKGSHQRENRNKNRRQQKQFSKEDPHVDIQA